MRAVLFGLLLTAMAGLSGPVHAQELFPLQKVAITQPMASPEIVGVTATPAAFLASPGNVDTQLSTTCLGPCPAAPSYALMTPTTGSCSSNNNSLFSLTSSGHLTASNLSTYGFACVSVSMTGAANTGIVFPVYMLNIPPPTISSATVTPAYFSPGGTFSGNIAIACDVGQNGPDGTIGTNNAGRCTGVPQYTLDNTPGHCAQANNTGPAGTTPTFAISGPTLSLTAPQNVVGNYYACVDVAVGGAQNTGAPFQLVATISHGPTDVPVIDAIYSNPPWYAPNSPYSGTLAAYCSGSVSQMTMPCGGPPTFSFQTNCGGNNNNNFASFSGASLVSTGALAGGGQFPCIAATIAGAQNSGVGQYVILYDSSSTASGSSATLTGITAMPWYFSTATGALSGSLKPICLNAVCTGTPNYQLSSSCANGGSDNGNFSVSGRTITAGATTPAGSYNPCLSVAMTGAGNTGASFELPVTVTASTSNCPATPPPQAVDAGFTTLAKCVDPADPFYANIFNWVNCAPSLLPYTAGQFWGSAGVWGNDCGTSEAHPEAQRVIDPMTGKWVLDFYWDGYADANLSGYGGQGDYHIISSPVDWPIGMYAEIKARLVPNAIFSIGGQQCCAPDFWSFTTGQATPYPPGCVKNDPTNWCYTGGAEADVVESYFGASLLDGVHETAIPTDMYGHPQCCATGQGYFTADVPHTQEMWFANNPADSIPFSSYSTFGQRYATDGVSTTQYCYYWDEAPVQSETGTGTPRFAPACQNYNYTGLGSIQYGRLRLRNQFNLWSAGGTAFNSVPCKNASSCSSAGDQGKGDQHLEVEYIAIWTCANYNKYNQGNGYDSQAPCPVSSYPYP